MTGFLIQMGSQKMFAERIKEVLGSLTLWGGLINLVIQSYLPVCVAMFVGMVGLQWSDLDAMGFYSNMCVIFLMQSWVLLPAILFVKFYFIRKSIG